MTTDDPGIVRWFELMANSPKVNRIKEFEFAISAGCFESLFLMIELVHSPISFNIFS
jgi:hypothetical protein